MHADRSLQGLAKGGRRWEDGESSFIKAGVGRCLGPGSGYGWEATVQAARGALGGRLKGRMMEEFHKGGGCDGC